MCAQTLAHGANWEGQMSRYAQRAAWLHVKINGVNMSVLEFITATGNPAEGIKGVTNDSLRLTPTSR